MTGGADEANVSSDMLAGVPKMGKGDLGWQVP